MNQIDLSASLIEVKAMRYTPAGLPALDVVLEHQSVQQEAGHSRQVGLKIRALALGIHAERLSKQALGSLWQFQGFLATPRHGSSVILHIQAFQQTFNSGGQDGHVQKI